jgi:hypothetical protein
MRVWSSRDKEHDKKWESNDDMKGQLLLLLADKGRVMQEANIDERLNLFLNIFYCTVF